MKDELNIQMLYVFLEKLKDIEDQKLDQNEASVEVGQLLKNMYIDSALQRSKKLEAKEKKMKQPKEKRAAHNISWIAFKRANVS